MKMCGYKSFIFISILVCLLSLSVAELSDDSGDIVLTNAGTRDVSDHLAFCPVTSYTESSLMGIVAGKCDANQCSSDVQCTKPEKCCGQPGGSCLKCMAPQTNLTKCQHMRKVLSSINQTIAKLMAEGKNVTVRQLREALSRTAVSDIIQLAGFDPEMIRPLMSSNAFDNATIAEMISLIKKQMVITIPVCTVVGKYERRQCKQHLDGRVSSCFCADPESGIEYGKLTVHQGKLECKDNPDKPIAGICPDPGNFTAALYRLMHNPTSCNISCAKDSDCADGMKCCAVGCDNVCTRPIKKDLSVCEVVRYQQGRVNDFIQAMMTLNDITIGAFVNRLKEVSGWDAIHIGQFNITLTHDESYYNLSIGQYMVGLAKNMPLPHYTCDEDGHFDSLQCSAYKNGTNGTCYCADSKTGAAIPNRRARWPTRQHCQEITRGEMSGSDLCPYPGNSADALYTLMTDPTNCSMECTADSTCGYEEKCCAVGCSYQCTKSQKSNLTLCQEKQYNIQMLKKSATELSTVRNVTVGEFVNRAMKVSGIVDLLSQFGVHAKNYEPYLTQYSNTSIGEVLTTRFNAVPLFAANCTMDGNFEIVQCRAYLGSKKIDCFCADLKTGLAESSHTTAWPDLPKCGVCARGRPLPNVFCGRGPTRQDCPETHACVVDPGDRWAVCCPHDTSSPEYNCKLGKELNRKSGKCEDCSHGFYREKPDQRACVPCPQRQTTRRRGAQNKTECIADSCELGEEFVTSSSLCEPCRRGFYRDKLAPAQVECKRCPNGRRTPETGAQSKKACTIDACRPGEELDDSHGDDSHDAIQICRPCPHGFYRSKLNYSEVACVPCPDGRSTDSVGASSKHDCTVVVCDLGSEFIRTSGKCRPCRRGFYRDGMSPAHRGCDPCPKNSSTSATGANSRANCSIACKKELHCADGCDISFARDANGCHTCDCLDPCKTVSCRPDELCSIDRNGTEASCLKLCLRLKCHKSCKGGVKKDRSGCDTCECHSPCEDHSCSKGEICVEVGKNAVCRKEKLGVCPPRNEVDGRCKNRCSEDKNCKGTAKCCHSSCGTACTSPESAGTCEKALKEAYKKREQKPSDAISWPRCALPSRGGTWKSVQTNDALGMSWCVDSEGAPIENTTRRGKPDCSHDPGTMPDEEVCPSGTAVFRCNPEICMSAYCPADPAAVCLVNPCGGCKTEFYNAINDIVECNKDISPCEMQLKIYMETEAKISGQIKGSIQRCIADQLDHERECEPRPEVPWPAIRGGRMLDVSSRSPLLEMCVHQLDPGTCRGSIDKWFYNTTLGECAVFKYSGCDGNANRFADQATCQHFCSRDVRKTTMIQGRFQPRCRDARYEYKQCHSGYCWCVNEHGQMINETITRGPLFCNAEGVRNGTDIISTACQDGRTPLSCAAACTESLCDKHPEAVCYADPCNKCKVMFRGPAGHTINCSASNAVVNQCDEPLTTGSTDCKRHSTRWYYNNDEGKCQKFVYSGCNGNRNKFRRKRDCEKECVKMEAIALPACGQDGYRIKVKCPGNVCKDRTCSRFPEIKCQADPCTCQPVFKDPLNDEAIDCNKVATLCNRDIATAEQMDDEADFIPDCDDQGGYQITQCSDTHCWCVNNDGTEQASTRVPYTTDDLHCTTILVTTVKLGFTFNVPFSRISGKLGQFIEAIRQKIGWILNALHAVGKTNARSGSIVTEVTLENTNATDATNATNATNQVDISSAADLIVREGSRGGMRIDFDGTVFIANASTFQAEPSYAALQESATTTESTATVGSTKAPEVQDKGPPLEIIIPCVAAACIIIVIVIIVVYRRQKRKKEDQKMSTRETLYGVRTSKLEYVSSELFQQDADKHLYQAVDNRGMTHDDSDDKPHKLAGELPEYVEVKF